MFSRDFCDRASACGVLDCPADQPHMNIYIGKTAARCPHCEGTDWLPGDPAVPLTVLSDVVCAVCRTEQIYADLVLQVPLAQQDLSSA